MSFCINEASEHASAASGLRKDQMFFAEERTMALLTRAVRLSSSACALTVPRNWLLSPSSPSQSVFGPCRLLTSRLLPKV